MAYVVKWVDRVGALQQSPRHISPSEALRFSHSLAALRPKAIWAENERGDRFPLAVGGNDPAGDDARTV